MDPQSFFTLKTHIQNCIFLIVFTTLASQSLSLNSKFQACEPKSCGNGPNISYPFRLPDQETYCGHQSFDVACQDNNAVLTISDDQYIVKDIFPGNHSLLVANAVAYTSTCPAPLTNISLAGTPFNIVPGYFNLSIFYGCNSKPPSYTWSIACGGHTNDTYFSFAYFDMEKLESDYSLNSCLHLVIAPVVVTEDLSGRNYTEILQMGFMLNWTAPNCSTCASSGGRCGFENNEFVCFCREGQTTDSCGSGSKVKLKIGIGVAAALGGGLLTCAIFFIYQYRNKKKYTPSSFFSRSITSDPSSKTDFEKGGNSLGVPIFTYAELEEATNNFDSSKELGDGGFGTVYYGKLRDGRAVAVKRLYENNYRRVEQFMNEVKILTHLRHQHLVTLYGCTSRHSRELLLVYEYISNGTVADHLHGERAKPGALPWPTRMNIAVDTASALAYLHASDIIHRDVKTNNILLDNHFCVKVADFGLSRLFPTDVTHVSTAPQGTPGYVDPEYHQCYQLTDKSDVYSFGVVLIELISSMPAVDITRHRHEINLANMAINKIQSHALHELVDPNLGFESDYKARKMMAAVAELAFRCLQCEKELRPSMEEVLQILEEIRRRDYSSEKAQKIDNLSDDIVLLKNSLPPLSPDSVTVKWISLSSTPSSSS